MEREKLSAQNTALSEDRAEFSRLTQSQFRTETKVFSHTCREYEANQTARR